MSEEILKELKRKLTKIDEQLIKDNHEKDLCLNNLSREFKINNIDELKKELSDSDDKLRENEEKKQRLLNKAIKYLESYD